MVARRRLEYGAYDESTRTALLLIDYAMTCVLVLTNVDLTRFRCTDLRGG